MNSDNLKVADIYKHLLEGGVVVNIENGTKYRVVDTKIVEEDSKEEYLEDFEPPSDYKLQGKKIDVAFVKSTLSSGSCPFCGNHDRDYSVATDVLGVMIENYECDKCKKTYQLHYKLFLLDSKCSNEKYEIDPNGDIK